MAQTTKERRSKLIRLRRLVDRLIDINQNAMSLERTLIKRGIADSDIIDALDELLDSGGPARWKAGENANQADFSSDGVLDLTFTGDTVTDQIINLLMSDNDETNPIKWASSVSQRESSTTVITPPPPSPPLPPSPSPSPTTTWSAGNRFIILYVGQEVRHPLPYITNQEVSYTYSLASTTEGGSIPPGMTVEGRFLVGTPTVASARAPYRISALDTSGRSVSSVDVDIEVRRDEPAPIFEFDIADIIVTYESSVEDPGPRRTQVIRITEEINPATMSYPRDLTMYKNGIPADAEALLSINDTFSFDVPLPTVVNTPVSYGVTLGSGDTVTFSITKLGTQTPVVESRIFNIRDIDVFSAQELADNYVQAYIKAPSNSSVLCVVREVDDDDNVISSDIRIMHGINNVTAPETGDTFNAVEGDVITIKVLNIAPGQSHRIGVNIGGEYIPYTISYVNNLVTTAQNGDVINGAQSTVHVIKDTDERRITVDYPYSTAWIPSGATARGNSVRVLAGFESITSKLTDVSDQVIDSNGYRITNGRIEAFDATGGAVTYAIVERRDIDIAVSGGNNRVHRDYVRLFVAEPPDEPCTVNDFSFGDLDRVPGFSDVPSNTIQITGNYVNADLSWNPGNVRVVRERGPNNDRKSSDSGRISIRPTDNITVFIKNTPKEKEIYHFTICGKTGTLSITPGACNVRVDKLAFAASLDRNPNEIVKSNIVRMTWQGDDQEVTFVKAFLVPKKYTPVTSLVNVWVSETGIEGDFRIDNSGNVRRNWYVMLEGRAPEEYDQEAYIVMHTCPGDRHNVVSHPWRIGTTAEGGEFRFESFRDVLGVIHSVSREGAPLRGTVYEGESFKAILPRAVGGVKFEDEERPYIYKFTGFRYVNENNIVAATEIVDGVSRGVVSSRAVRENPPNGERVFEFIYHAQDNRKPDPQTISQAMQIVIRPCHKTPTIVSGESGKGSDNRWPDNKTNVTALNTWFLSDPIRMIGLTCPITIQARAITRSPFVVVEDGVKVLVVSDFVWQPNEDAGEESYESQIASAYDEIGDASLTAVVDNGDDAAVFLAIRSPVEGGRVAGGKFILGDRTATPNEWTISTKGVGAGVEDDTPDFHNIANPFVGRPGSYKWSKEFIISGIFPEERLIPFTLTTRTTTITVKRIRNGQSTRYDFGPDVQGPGIGRFTDNLPLRVGDRIQYLFYIPATISGTYEEVSFKLGSTGTRTIRLQHPPTATPLLDFEDVTDAPLRTLVTSNTITLAAKAGFTFSGDRFLGRLTWPGGRSVIIVPNRSMLLPEGARISLFYVTSSTGGEVAIARALVTYQVNNPIIWRVTNTIPPPPPCPVDFSFREKVCSVPGILVKNDPVRIEGVTRGVDASVNSRISRYGMGKASDVRNNLSDYLEQKAISVGEGDSLFVVAEAPPYGQSVTVSVTVDCKNATATFRTPLKVSVEDRVPNRFTPRNIIGAMPGISGTIPTEEVVITGINVPVRVLGPNPEIKDPSTGEWHPTSTVEEGQTIRWNLPRHEGYGASIGHGITVGNLTATVFVINKNRPLPDSTGHYTFTMELDPVQSTFSDGNQGPKRFVTYDGVATETLEWGGLTADAEGSLAITIMSNRWEIDSFVLNDEEVSLSGGIVGNQAQWTAEVDLVKGDNRATMRLRLREESS